MPHRESTNGLEAEALEGWVEVYGPFASTVMSADAARRTAERLLLAADMADSQEHTSPQ